jgi:hypothetical protein
MYPNIEGPDRLWLPSIERLNIVLLEISTACGKRLRRPHLQKALNMPLRLTGIYKLTKGSTRA